MRIINLGTRENYFLRASGENVLITLKYSILSKDGGQYKYIQGIARAGCIQNYTSYNDEYIIFVGEEPNQIAIPFSNIASIHQNNKILKNGEILVI